MDHDPALPPSTFKLTEGSVALRPFTEAHLESSEYLGWMNDQDITRTLGRFDYLFPVSRDKLRAYYAGLNPATTIFLAIYASLNDGEPGRFIGTLKLYDIDTLARRASIGILVGDRNAWGKGIASKAISAACRYVFDELGFGKVTAGYVANNVGMHKAFERNGFVVEGVLKSQVYFAGRLVDHVLVAKFKDASR